MSTQQVLSDLFQAYREGHIGRTELYTDVAARLSRVGHKSPPWSADYIQAVSRGTLAPSKKLARAVEVLAAAVDGTPAVIVDTEPVTVYARPGTVQPGALIDAVSMPCEYPPCTFDFVKTHWNMHYCPVHRDPRSRK
jgi:hypothetical protein